MIGFIDEEGCRLLLLDFSNLQDNAATLARIAEAKQFFLALPKKKDRPRRVPREQPPFRRPPAWVRQAGRGRRMLDERQATS